MADTPEITTWGERRRRYREVQRLWRAASADVAKHKAAMEEAAERYPTEWAEVPA